MLKQKLEDIKKTIVETTKPHQKIIGRLLDKNQISIEEAVILLTIEVSLKIENIDNHCGIISGGDGILNESGM